MDQVKIFVQGRISRPINGSKLIFHMRMYLYEPVGIYKSHDLMTYISQSAVQGFMLRGEARGQYLGHHRFSLFVLNIIRDVGSVGHKH